MRLAEGSKPISGPTVRTHDRAWKPTAEESSPCPIIPSPLASGQIVASGDALSVELVEPHEHPGVIMIHWPDHATVVQPARFNAVAAEIMRLLAAAGTIRRSGDDDHDLNLAAALARSSKDLEEHEYAVRSVARALVHFCSGMNVPDAPYVLQLPNVLHLATDITAVADKGVWRR